MRSGTYPVSMASLVLRHFPGSWFKNISRGSRRIYKSKPDRSKVHSPDSPSASKEVGRSTSSTMQALIPVFAILGVATSAQLTLLPYAYLADPLPVYHQSQDTHAGVHAYSYAGGPSAKEEVRGLDGVTRGSYSYIDANGILQSVFYVADEGGFRVAATNLPVDGNLPVGTGSPILLARNVLQESAKEEAGRTTSRRKRSLEASTDNQDQKENPSSQEDQNSANASLKSSHSSPVELPAQEEKVDAGRTNRDTVVAPVYGLSDSILVPRLIGAATSSQSRVDVHNNVRLKAIQPVETIGVLSAPAYEAVILPSQVPLAISQQSRVQVHDNLRVERPEKLVKDASQPKTSPEPAINLRPLPVLPALPDYNENRIQLHKSLGLEGSNPKNAIKLDAVPLAIVETPIKTPVAVVPTIAKEALPVVATAVSSQSRTQIHRNAKLEVAVPIVSGPTVYVAPSYAQPIASWPILATPLAQSSQYRSQIHSNEKLVLTK
ncbi:LOW QUALITY PROTEIN: uncharacterized protein [Anoplolepis gracilipes]|uniref:LOW QUALITY PROTEIN: uncharacterized protein n=1 Tax=Anoplolepis gracilipes TaxID=354296 RepID=UPI003B9E75CE